MSDALDPDRPGPVQLPMFMRARDIVDSLTGTLDRSHLPVEEVMEQKLDQATEPLSAKHGSGVYDDVAERGVLNPVQLVHGINRSIMLGQGHHRVAAAADLEAKRRRDMWLPVVHSEAPVDAYSDIMEKRGAIADYRSWSENSPALGQDIGWMQQREDADSDFYGDDASGSSI